MRVSPATANGGRPRKGSPPETAGPQGNCSDDPHELCPRPHFELVKCFPLTDIQGSAQLRAAQAVIDRLLMVELDAGGEAYLERADRPGRNLRGRPRDDPGRLRSRCLRALMASYGLSQPSLAMVVGIVQSTISAVLNEKRSLTKGQIVNSPDTFTYRPLFSFRVEGRSRNGARTEPSQSSCALRGAVCIRRRKL